LAGVAVKSDAQAIFLVVETIISGLKMIVFTPKKIKSESEAM
jgi:hypothetical protein